MIRHETSEHQDLIDRFCSAKSLRDLSSLLNFSPKDLAYILYHLSGGREFQYTTFSINKKNGGKREISAPVTGLKEIQKRLNEVLQIVYWEKPCVHSFIKERSILTNAKKHVKKRYILNVDLKDFFPSINFGRVRGLFIAPPYNLDPKAATTIAQISCYKNTLPQGSPCSPIISNMICSKLDNNLQKLARNTGCSYTRYADDITFSTNKRIFPPNIVSWKGEKLYLGADFKKIIKANGFTINTKKTNLQTRTMRQEVTGLIVNEYVNVRRKLIQLVRGMLYVWEKFGLENAEKVYHEKHLGLPAGSPGPSYRNVVRGKIEFIHMVKQQMPNCNSNKGGTSLITKRLLPKYYECIVREGNLPIIRTEGHTDWMHLYVALQNLKSLGKHSRLDLDFFKIKEPMAYGNTVLLNFCKNAYSSKPFPKKIICVFDSDDNSINKDHSAGLIKNWSNNVYSFILPKERTFNSDRVSVEMFYYKKTIKTKDTNGRRLFLSDEFNKDGTHKNINGLKYGYDLIKKQKVKNWVNHLGGPTSIISSNVNKFKGSQRYNVALSKSQFARYILQKEPGFDNVNFNKFSKIFDLIEKIINK